MDSLSVTTLFIILAILLLCSAFFSGSETSMMALNRHRLKNLIRNGSKSARLTYKLLSKVDKLLGSILLGNTLLNVAAAAIVNIIILKLFGQNDLAILMGTLALTLTLLIFSEIMPKIVAASFPEKIALPASYVLTPLTKLFHPVVTIAGFVVKGVLWVLRIKIETDQSQQKMTMEELRGLVLDSEHFLPQKHQAMLLNLVDLQKVTVNDVMVPRNQIEALNLQDSAESLRHQIITSHHTLLPVYDETVGDMVGVLHLKRVPALLQDNELDLDKLRDALMEPYFIPGDTSLLSQLQQFQERQARLGLVVDEYGELLGLVTLENILEEIVGEYTTHAPSHGGRSLQQEEDGSVLLEGSISLRDLNRKMDFRFPLDGAKTLNGLILDHLEVIPEAETSLKIAGYPMQIVQVQDRAIKVVRVFPREETEPVPLHD